MDEFTRAMVFIIGGGTLVVAIGALLVLLTFRAYGNEATSRGRRIGLAAAMLTFIIVCCGALYYFAE